MIKIHKSTAKRTLGQFYVTVYGKNGEPLMHSECLKTKASAIKNIKAMAGVFRVSSEQPVKVLDCSGKVEKEIVL